MAHPAPASILLVDADEANLDTLRMLLQSHGHRCLHAVTASEALSLCGRERFHCMLLHASLGGTSGIALAERLSQSAVRPTHVVLMSGRPRTDFVDQLRDGVVDDFIRKPADAEEVLALVERCLSTTSK